MLVSLAGRIEHWLSFVKAWLQPKPQRSCIQVLPCRPLRAWVARRCYHPGLKLFDRAALQGNNAGALPFSCLSEEIPMSAPYHNNNNAAPAADLPAAIEQPRRDFLKQGVALGALTLAGSQPLWSSLALGAEETLVPFSDMPPDFIAPPVAPGATHYLDSRSISSFYTPNDDFYIIQHYNQPAVDTASFSLRVTGLVNKTLNLDLAAIRSRPKIEIDAGFECGGNGGRLFQGLIGNARWGGTSLKALLEEAGVKAEGIEVVFYGADKGTEKIRDIDVEQNFGRSMHIDDALSGDILLAYEMNGEPLPLYHGAPLRLVVPGWYGVANVKWLNQIHLQDRRFMGRFMGRDYVTLSKQDIGGEVRWEERSVTRIRLKSSIVRLTKSGNRHTLTGFVLNDGTPLKTVEVSIDGGAWQPAKLDTVHLRLGQRHGWRTHLGLARHRRQRPSTGDPGRDAGETNALGKLRSVPPQSSHRLSINETLRAG
jgi:DMSO/TMAO reductase YedYZ molybdopterin-dependent catalytic subunit